MIAAAGEGRRAVVIGGGLLGLEAAYGLLRRGMDVTVVHLLDTLMEKQLDAAAAAMLKAALEEKGLKFLMEHQTEAILGETRVEGVRFANGLEIPADLVVMAVGIRPNIELARKAGLHCERGVVVSDTMQTYDPRIYAVGECVQHRGVTYGLVAPLFEQAKVAANHLARIGIARYEGSLVSTKLKVTGIDLFSAGDYLGGEGTESLLLQDPGRGVYKKLVLRDDRIVGCTASSAACSTATRWTAPGISSSCATAPTSPRCAPSSSSARPTSATPATARSIAWRPCRTMPRSAAATASPRARSSAPSPRRGSSRSRRCAPTPRPRAPAARARRSSRRCSRTPWAATTSRRRPRSPCAPARSARTTRCARPSASTA